MNDENMWQHNCSVDGKIMVGKGEACSWCGATEPQKSIRLVWDSEKTEMIVRGSTEIATTEQD